MVLSPKRGKILRRKHIIIFARSYDPPFARNGKLRLPALRVNDRLNAAPDTATMPEQVIPAKCGNVRFLHRYWSDSGRDVKADRVRKLVLLETNPFYLLAQAACAEAFAETMELPNCIKKFGALGQWATAAERFSDYWNGNGTWQEMPSDRRLAFMEALKPNFFEWDAVMNETTSAAKWATLLPRNTLLMCDPETVMPIREINQILRRSCPVWAHQELPGAGHMAPLTHPELVNPVVRSFLEL